MAMTFAEKILARKAGKDKVVPGEIVNVIPDIAMSHDNTAAISKTFYSIGVDKVFDPDIHAVILDHCVPAATEKYALNHKEIREFVEKQGIRKFHDMNNGVCHQIMCEKAYALPGRLIVGSDSHTTTYGAFEAFAAGIGRSETAVIMATGKIWLRVPETMRIDIIGKFADGIGSKDLILKIIGDIGADGGLYRAVEFWGETVFDMSIASRMVMTNMAAEMGAKIGYCKADKKLVHYIKSRIDYEYEPLWSDTDAHYDEILKYDVTDLGPQVACPHTVDNVKPVQDVKGVKVHQALLGTCTNGRLEDFEAALNILDGKKVHSAVRLLVFPASMEIYRDMVDAGYIRKFIDCGAVVMNPGCGPCLGAHEGALAPGEVCISTANRNFRGRMGCKESEIYLASPATVAASAVTGVISDFREVE